MHNTIPVPKDLVIDLLNYLEICVETNKHTPDESVQLVSALSKCLPTNKDLWFRVITPASRRLDQVGKLVRMSGTYPDCLLYLNFPGDEPYLKTPFFGSELQAADAPS